VQCVLDKERRGRGRVWTETGQGLDEQWSPLGAARPTVSAGLAWFSTSQSSRK